MADNLTSLVEWQQARADETPAPAACPTCGTLAVFVRVRDFENSFSRVWNCPAENCRPFYFHTDHRKPSTETQKII
jgi:hypothetical protein